MRGNRAILAPVIAGTPADKHKTTDFIKAERGEIVFGDFKEKGCRPTCHCMSRRRIEKKAAKPPAPRLRVYANGEDFRFATAEPRNHQPVQSAFWGVGDIGEGTGHGEKPRDRRGIPRVIETGAMKRGHGGGKRGVCRAGLSAHAASPGSRPPGSFASGARI